MTNIEAIDLSNCVIRDEDKNILALVSEDGSNISVFPTSRCSIGMYFYILWQLTELGWTVK